MGSPRRLTETDFKDYQHWMTGTLQNYRRALLAAFMGSGKTATCLHAFSEMRKRGTVRKALVVAPLKVSEYTWPGEILKWEFCRDLHFSVVTGTVEERQDALDEEYDVLVVNRENLVWLIKEMDLEKTCPFDVLIYDEASRLKSGSMFTTQVKRKDGTRSERKASPFSILARVAVKFNYIWELSGTPAPNGVVDLWGPMYVLDHGRRLGTTKSAFEKRWFQRNNFTNKVEPLPGAEEQIVDQIKDVFFYLKESDYRDMLPVHVLDRYVSLNKEDMLSYRRFVKTLVLEEHDIEAVNRGVLTGKLLQYANGSVYDSEDDLDPSWAKGLIAKAQHIHDEKLFELDSLLAETSGHNVLIFYSYKFDVYRIKQKYPWMRVFGQTASDYGDWNAGKIRAMVLHAASAGHGLNFQDGGNIAVWYGLPWSLELYQQANKRLDRQGQKADRVMLYRILARDTMDERVSTVLEMKDATQDRILDQVRVHLNRDVING